ncbi:MAG: MarR family transcriptional regulator [Ideonella sp. MAG2]|nr:MAG: MarR family transcriptional regulator [Ideonella sp. MAG2]
MCIRDRFKDMLLFRLSRIVAAGGAPVLRLCEGRYGITRREWRVIASLPDGRPMLSSELADHLRLDRARTSRAITSLVAKGLLRRDAVQGDQRKAAVALTDKGRALFASLFPQVQDMNEGILSQFSDANLALLDQMLHTLQVQAERVGTLDGLPKANRRRGSLSSPAKSLE